LERLASFVAVGDAGGLSAAAEGDAVRQSQLSRQLKELEEFFGVTLIERRRGVFRLTAAGRGLIEVARPALVRLEDFDRRCTAQLTEVHLGAGESVLVWLVSPRLRTLLDKDPNLGFTFHNLRSEEILTRLRQGRLDFGIVRCSTVGAGLTSAPLGKVEYALFMSAGATRKRRGTTAAQKLGQVPLVLLEGGGSVGDALTDWAASNRISLRVRLRCTSLVQAAAAVQDLGLAAVLPVWAEVAFAPGTTEHMSLPALRSVDAPLHLIWSKRQLGVRPVLVGLAKMLANTLKL